LPLPPGASPPPYPRGLCPLTPGGSAPLPPGALPPYPRMINLKINFGK